MLGMNEEQFWRANPAIIKVWEKSFRLQEEHTNAMIHAYIGNYGLSALVYAIDHCLNGQKARTKYIEKPIRLFEMTEEEKKKEQEKALSAFIGWAEFTKDEFDRKQK